MASKTKRLLKIILIGIPVALLLVAAVFLLFLNSIVKNTIQTAGPLVLKAPVTVDSVRLHPLLGRGEIRGLVVGNPEGFKTDNAFKLDLIKIAFQTSSLTADKLIIDEIIIDAPEITYERALRNDNLGQLLRNVEAFTGPKANQPDRPESTKPGKKYQINRFELNGTRANMSITAARGLATTLPLPDIHLSNIGQGEQGVTGVEVLAQVLRQIVPAVVGVANDAIAKLGGAAAAIGAAEVGGVATDAAKKGAEALKGVGSGVVGGLRGLVGGDDDKE